MQTMSHKERLRAALAGEPVDRVPVALWGHDFAREFSAQGLA
jgi:uroporphyrinogen decarboxylase